MSSGGSKSILHKDAFNAINCLYNGTKEWKLIENKYEEKIYKYWEPDREIGGFSRINPEKVNLIKYPKVAEVPWSFVTVQAGDCLFLPKSKLLCFSLSQRKRLRGSHPQTVHVHLELARLSQCMQRRDCFAV